MDGRRARSLQSVIRSTRLPPWHRRGHRQIATKLFSRLAIFAGHTATARHPPDRTARKLDSEI